jgi:hypothetical protein
MKELAVLWGVIWFFEKNWEPWLDIRMNGVLFSENLKNHPDTQHSMVHFVILNFQVVLCKVKSLGGCVPK